MDQGTAAPRHTRYMNADDWISHREQITRLYRDENKTLKQTMDIIELEQGLKATIKMWKRKITEWGLDKNNKKDNVLAMLRKKAERDAAGKKTVFKLKGRDVDFKDVQRYAKRNHISETAIGELVGFYPQTPPDIQCLTPEPVPGFITGRDAYHVQENILRRVQTYMVGGYQQGMWGLGLDGFRVTTPPLQTRTSYEDSELKVASDHFTRAVHSAGGLLRDERLDDALSCLFSACAVVEIVVREATFHRIMLLFWHPTYFNKDPGVVAAISRWIVAKASSVLRFDDPRREIYLLMGHLEADQLSTLHLALCSLLAEEVGRLIGEFNDMTWTQKLEPLKYQSGGRESHGWLTQMSREADEFFGPYDIFPIHLLRLKARLCYYMSQYTRAEEGYRETIRRLQALHHMSLPKRLDWAWYYQQCVHELARAQDAQGNRNSAVASIKSGFRQVETAFNTGYQSPALLDFLEILLRQLGRYDEADGVRAQRLSCPREEHVLPSFFTGTGGPEYQ